MEVVERFQSVNIVCTDPSELFVGIFVAGPFDEIPELNPAPPIDLRVNDLFDLEVFFAVNDFDCSRRRFLTARKRVRNMGLELRNMEYRMNLPEVRRKPDGIGGGGRFRNDFERANVGLGELRSQTPDVKELDSYEGEISDLQPGIRRALPVSSFLVSLLSEGDLLPEVLVQILEIDDEVLSICVSDIAFGVNGDCRIIAFVREERRNACRGVRSIVECELGKGK